jgi:hypothetical protein
MPGKEFILTKATTKAKVSEAEWPNLHKCSYIFT